MLTFKPAPVLSSHPSPEEIEAARPENGKSLQKGRETRDYWYKFLVAVESHGVEVMRSAYNMGVCTFRDEVQKARRITRRLDEIAEIEAKGEIIPQTFFPSPPVQPGQQLYVPDPTAKANSKKATPKSKSKTTATQKTKTATPTRKPPTTLFSPHMKRTLSFLRNQLLANPSALPPLPTLASRFSHPLLCADQTYLEREAFSSCETAFSIANWLSWCEITGNAVVEAHGKERVAVCLGHCIRFWQEQVWYEEQAGKGFLGESFLTYVMGRLEDLDGVDEEVEDEERGYEEAAREAQAEEVVEERFLRV